MKRWFMPLALAIVFGGLWGYTHFLDKDPAILDEEQKREEMKVWDFVEDDVQQVSLVQPDQTITVRRDGDQWVLVEPRQLEADQAQANYLVEKLTAMRAHRQVENAGSAEEYGLNDPWLQVQIELRDGSQRVLLVGEETPIQTANFARRQGLDEVITVGVVLVNDWQQNLDYWREHYFVDLPEQLEEIEIAAAGNQLRLQMVEGQWVLQEPFGVMADADRVDDLLRSLRYLRAEKFLLDDPSPSDLERYGLDEPTTTIWARGAGQEEKLMLGGRTPDRDGAYATIKENPTVFQVGRFSMLSLEPDALDLVRRQVIGLSIEDLDYLHWDSDGKQRELTKKGEAWFLQGKGKMQGDELQPLWTRLQRLRSWKVLAVDPLALKQYGIDSDSLTLRAGSRQLTLIPGSVQDDQRYLLSQEGAHQFIYLVDKDELGEIMATFK